MNINGLDLSGLAHEAEKIELPPTVKGRTVHIDADFLAYQCSAEKADGTDQKSFEDMKHNAEVAVATLKGLAGAEYVHLHLTPGTSDKGQRYTLAVTKEYQGNRIDKPKPRYLGIMREWMGQKFPGTLHTQCEADDGMASSQYAAIKAGLGNLSIIASKDKDLAMVPGLQLDWDLGSVGGTEAYSGGFDTFGHIRLHERVSGSGAVTKKIKGFGWKLFWAQMLTGDTADNISGLPLVHAPFLNSVAPTKVVDQAFACLGSPMATEAQKIKARKSLEERKPSKIGPVLAYDILKDCDTNAKCFAVVKELYRLHGQKTGFLHWKTGEPVEWNKVFISEAQLLWMRREPHNPMCVVNWWKETLH